MPIDLGLLHIWVVNYHIFQEPIRVLLGWACALMRCLECWLLRTDSVAENEQSIILVAGHTDRLCEPGTGW